MTAMKPGVEIDDKGRVLVNIAVSNEISVISFSVYYSSRPGKENEKEKQSRWGPGRDGGRHDARGGD